MHQNTQYFTVTLPPSEEPLTPKHWGVLGSADGLLLKISYYFYIDPDDDNNKCTAVAEMGDRLAIRDMGQKVGCYAPF